MEKLTRAEIQKRLRELAQSAPPRELARGACCYAVAPLPEQAEYVCPKCGERTLCEAREKRSGWFFTMITGEEPLKKHLRRLEELLGVKADEQSA